MALKLDAKIPAGALAEKWSNHKAAIKVVSPANKRKLDIIIVGTGLGGASAAASLGDDHIHVVLGAVHVATHGHDARDLAALGYRRRSEHADIGNR